LGFFTHSPADMRALWEAMGRTIGQPEDVTLGAPVPMLDVDRPMAAAFQAALSQLQRAGVRIRPLDLARALAGLNEASTTVMFYEGARFHQARHVEHGPRLEHLADLVRDGLRISVERYDEARRFIDKCRDDFSEAYKATPVILVPAATGHAPYGLASTGDPRMNAPWTALGTPAILIPLPLTNGLPLGLQLTADHGQDARVIQAAVAVDRMLTPL